ncbi:MAG: acetyltransferase [Leifsonia sp.]
MNNRTVGFIGLGIMGVPMATNLVKAGFDVVVWARAAAPAQQLVAEGARAVGGPAEVFAAAETVILMMRDEPAVDAVLARGTAAFAERMAGRTLVQMGTFTTAFSSALAAEVGRAGGRYVEAPVSGSRGPAVQGALVAMLAGDPDAIAHVEPVVAAMCAQSFRCGPVPAALTMKLVVNTFLITMVTGLAETFHFAAGAGADLDVLREVLRVGPMSSEVSRGKAQKLTDGDLSAQAAIADVLKNARLAEDAAIAAGTAHPLIRASRQLYEEAAAAGLGRQDMIGVIGALDARAALAGEDDATLAIRAASAQEHGRLLTVWRAAVEATHDFLTPDEIDDYEGQVRAYLPQMPEIAVAVEADGVVGFLAHDRGRIEMLFVDPAHQGHGIGRALVDRVSGRHTDLEVDVNEENAGARRFYATLGFHPVGRSETDGEGKPHPILHLRRRLG